MKIEVYESTMIPGLWIVDAGGQSFSFASNNPAKNKADAEKKAAELRRKAGGV